METLEESGIDIHAEAQPAKRHCGKKPRKKEAAMGKTKKSKKSPVAGRSGHSQDTHSSLASAVTAMPHRSKSDLTHFSWTGAAGTIVRLH